MTVRIGMIGLGAVGRRVLRNFLTNPEARIAFVCDANGELAASTARELGDVAWSTDYRAMLTGDQVDLVYVGVPPKYHHRIVLDVVAAGKHLFCEKPLAISLAEAKEMEQKAAAARLVTAINLGLHYAPGVGVLQEQIAAGYLGDFRRAALNIVFPQWPRAWQQNPWIGSREQGGAVREVCPHLFEMVLRLFGPVTRVRAHMEYPADPAACELGATGLLELASGRLVTVDVLCNVPRPETVALTAYGTAGTLGLVRWAAPVGAPGDGPLEPLPVPEGPELRITDQVIRAVQGEQVDLPTFADGVAIQALLEAWETAAATGDWVPVA